MSGYNLSGEAKWLSETFDWQLVQANEFVRGIQAATLRAAAEQVYGFRDWYPTSVFPPLNDMLSGDYRPSVEQVSAQMGRHCYGEVVPRNLRQAAADIESGEFDGLPPTTTDDPEESA